MNRMVKISIYAAFAMLLPLWLYKVSEYQLRKKDDEKKLDLVYDIKVTGKSDSLINVRLNNIDSRLDRLLNQGPEKEKWSTQNYSSLSSDIKALIENQNNSLNQLNTVIQNNTHTIKGLSNLYKKNGGLVDSIRIEIDIPNYPNSSVKKLAKKRIIWPDGDLILPFEISDDEPGAEIIIFTSNWEETNIPKKLIFKNVTLDQTLQISILNNSGGISVIQDSPNKNPLYPDQEAKYLLEFILPYRASTSFIIESRDILTNKITNRFEINVYCIHTN